VSAAFAAISARLPKGWGDLGRQVAILVSVDLAYTFVRGIADGQKAIAMTHGQQVIDFEKATGTFFEPSLQAFFLPAQGIIDLANQLYLNAQFSIALGFLVWLYLFRNQSYYFVRNMFVVSMGLALVGYALFPTAPPRLMPEWGFTDSVASFTGVDPATSSAGTLFNPFAAVPSMHVAFALMIGWPLAKLVKWRALRVFWTLYSFIVTLVIVVVLKRVLPGGIRVDAEEEESGLDLNEHSETAYAYDRV